MSKQKRKLADPRRKAGNTGRKGPYRERVVDFDPVRHLIDGLTAKERKQARTIRALRKELRITQGMLRVANKRIEDECITPIAPIETPFWNAAPKVPAAQVAHEWVLDELTAEDARRTGWTEAELLAYIKDGALPDWFKDMMRRAAKNAYYARLYGATPEHVRTLFVQPMSEKLRFSTPGNADKFPKPGTIVMIDRIPSAWGWWWRVPYGWWLSFKKNVNAWLDHNTDIAAVQNGFDPPTDRRHLR